MPGEDSESALPLSMYGCWPIQTAGTCACRADECPAAVWDLVRQCMAASPAVRPSARDIVRILSQPDSMLISHLPSRTLSPAVFKVRHAQRLAPLEPLCAPTRELGSLHYCSGVDVFGFILCKKARSIERYQEYKATCTEVCTKRSAQWGAHLTGPPYGGPGRV